MSEPVSDPQNDFWEGRTVLVTGGNGFLGSALCSALARRSPAEILTPTSAEFDLTSPVDVDKMIDANRAQYGQSAIYLMPTNLYGPGDSSMPPSATSSLP